MSEVILEAIRSRYGSVALGRPFGRTRRCASGCRGLRLLEEYVGCIAGAILIDDYEASTKQGS